MEQRLKKLSEAYLDGTFDHSTYQDRHNDYITEKMQIEESLAKIKTGENSSIKKLERVVELLKSEFLSYKTANPERRQEIFKMVYANLHVEQKNVDVTYVFPWSEFANRPKVTTGAEGGSRLQVNFLTEISRSPPLAVLAFRFAHDSAKGLAALRFVANRFTLGQIGSLASRYPALKMPFG